MALIGQVVSEEKIFEIVDGRRTDGRTPDHGHPISSPCEPNGSGELIKALRLYPSDKNLVVNMKKGFLAIQLI